VAVQRYPLLYPAESYGRSSDDNTLLHKFGKSRAETLNREVFGD
jgi:hypothetical protein